MPRKLPLYEFSIPADKHPAYPQARRIRYLPESGRDGPGGYLQSYANLERFLSTPRSAGPRFLGGVFEHAVVLEDARAEISGVRVEDCAIVRQGAILEGAVHVKGASIVRDSLIRGRRRGEDATIRLHDVLCVSSQLRGCGELRDVRLYQGAELTGYFNLTGCSAITALRNYSNSLYARGISFENRTEIRCPISLIGDASLRCVEGRELRTLKINTTDDLRILSCTQIPYGVVAYADGRITIGCQELRWKQLEEATTHRKRQLLLQSNDMTIETVYHLNSTYPGIDWHGVIREFREALMPYYKMLREKGGDVVRVVGGGA